jgi:hypothetical protein
MLPAFLLWKGGKRLDSYFPATMFLSHLFLRNVERITLITVIATGTVVGGISLLILDTK